jgi:hypothetical protein
VSGGPVDPGLDQEIRNAIGDFPEGILVSKTGTSPPLVIKYISPEYANTYYQPGQGLFISTTPGFTWGRATYVTPLAYPTSSAIFGRAGIVAAFNPDPSHPDPPRSWKTFDTTNPANEQLYLRWLQTRLLYRSFALTAHSGYISQMLRDAFRRNYEIDCVLFRPDQSNPHYTRIRSDVWMAVTEWHKTPAGRNIIVGGFSSRFRDARLTVLIEEEFQDQRGGIHRAGLLNLATPATYFGGIHQPGSRDLIATPFDDDLTDKIFHAYQKGLIVRVLS